MHDHEQKEEFSLKNYFVPLTTGKAVHWIIIIGLVVFANMLFNGFVWDDITYIIINPEVHSFNLFHLFSNNEFNSSGYYRPIPAVYFALLYVIFGAQSFFYHFPQLCLHIVDACLVFYFLKKFFRLGLSFFLTLIFLVHPIQVESVAYIGASQSELFFFFGIVALLLSTRKKITGKSLVSISVLLLLSLLTKEIGILFIVMILFFQFLFNKKRTLLFIPYVIVSIACYLFIRFALARVFLEKNDFVPLGHFSFLGRLVNVPEVVYYYIKTLFYPAQLSIDQLWTIKTVDLQHFYYPLFVDVVFFSLIGYLGYYLYHNKKEFFRLYFFFLVWFGVGLAMILQLYPLDMTVAERWFYFPIVGLLGLFGIAVESITVLNKNTKKIISVIAVSILIAFSLRSMVRNTNWSDAITLYTHDAQISDNFDIEDFLGTQLAFAHEYKAALPHIKYGVAVYPHDTNLYDLGYIYEQLGDYQNAKIYYERVLAQNDRSSGRAQVLQNTYDGLTRVLFLHDKPTTAKAFFEKAVKVYPDNGSYWAYLALSTYALHQQDEALAAAEKAKTLLPNDTTDKLYRRIKNKQVINVKE